MKIRFPRVTFIVVTLLLLFFVLPHIFSIVRSQPSPIRDQLAANAVKHTIDLKHIPIGDGRISNQAKRGYVWSCRVRLGGDGIGGAQASGTWIHPDGTYDLAAKPTVNGRVYWNSQFTIRLRGGVRSIMGNRLPSSPTGQFPISSSDDAYQYDRNPNTISPAHYQIDLPALPQTAETPSCLPLGAIGVLINGGYFFNALDAGGRDAVAHEIQDACQGHPEITGAYHYHNVTSCLDISGGKHSILLGYALDGFGIYGHRGEDGKVLTNADLDACHGHIHPIAWDGKQINLYHYHATWEYPYTIGCYRGTTRNLTQK
jgi:hypothetical protein